MKMLDANSKDLRTVSKSIKESLNNQPIEVQNVSHLHGLAAGLKHGEVIIKGNAGDYLGVLNAGATIKVTKNTGNYVADNMTAGTIIIEGNAGYGAAQYCYGGIVVIHGDAGDFTATMNKGATIIVLGNVGAEAGTYMLDGDLVVIGNAGENFANYLIRGNVYIGGEWDSLGHNTRLEPLDHEDIEKLHAYIETYQFEAEPEKFKKIVAASEKPFYH
jgi:glutamate synthase domain-containing protein 3